MKKIIIVIIVIVILAIFVIANQEKEVSNGKETIKIGMSLPLTGNVAVAGQPAKEAALMAMEEWSTKDTKYNYELIMEDNSFQAKNVSMNHNKFKNLDKVDAMISFFSMPGKIFAEANKSSNKPVPHITCSWGNSVLEGAYNFNNVSSDETFVEVMVNKLKKEGIKSIGFVNMNESFAYEMQEIMAEELAKENIRLAFDEKFNTGSRDFRTLLSKIKNEDIDIIFVQLLVTEFQLFYQQMKEMGIDVPITTINRISEVDNKNAFEGMWYATNTVIDQEIGNKFRARADMEPQSGTLNNYDSLNILIYAFETAETVGSKPTAEEALASLNNIKTWNGGSGKLTFLGNGRIDYRPQLAIIENGEVKIIEE